MRKKTRIAASSTMFCASLILFFGFVVAASLAADLPEIKQSGVLRHLGVPYANFVTGSGDGLDVETIKLFAQQLGVKYEYVPTTWGDFITDLSGKKAVPKGDDAEITGIAPVKGDIAANGITILPWRAKVIDFSVPTFPNQVWLVARADLPIKPIEPSGDPMKDVATVKSQLKGLRVMGMANTCLDPNLYELDKSGAQSSVFEGSLNELIPAVINGKADATLQDVADALMAMEKWPGKVKIIGPVSEMQELAYGFSKSSPQLREAFNKFFEQSMKDGTYLQLVQKYYPAIPKYYPAFFEQTK
jgi:ABC-type amino acid transport substrate-binding protein